MYPTLPLGPFAVPTHSTFVLLGVLVAAFVFFFEARRRAMLDERLVGIVIGTLLCGAVGARLATLGVGVPATSDPLIANLIFGGKSILGGLSGAYLGAHLFKRVLGYRERTGDLFAPAIALGMAVGRVGCLLTEQIGTPTGAPWGVVVSTEMANRIPNCPACLPGARLHPSFLYEILFHLAAFAILWWYLRPRISAKGELLKFYFLAYALFRFAVEFVRGNEPVWEGLSRSQIFLIPTTLLLLAYLWRNWRRGLYRGPPAAPAPAFGPSLAQGANADER